MRILADESRLEEFIGHAAEILGRPVDDRECAILRNNLTDLRAAADRLDAESAVWPRDICWKNFNEDVHAARERCRADLGDEVFAAVFGESRASRPVIRAIDRIVSGSSL